MPSQLGTQPQNNKPVLNRELRTLGWSLPVPDTAGTVVVRTLRTDFVPIRNKIIPFELSIWF